MSKNKEWLDEIFTFGYEDPTFIHDVHVLIGGEGKVEEAKAQIFKAINERIQNLKKLPITDEVGSEYKKEGYNQAIKDFLESLGIEV